MNRLELREKYMQQEAYRQMVANAPWFDRNAFIQSYKDALELFPISKVNSAFYQEEQSINAFSGWRINTLLSMLPNNSTKTLLNVGSGWEGKFEQVALIHNPFLSITSSDQLSSLDYKGNEYSKYIQTDATEIGKFFPPDNIDIIVCSEMMEHIPPNKTMLVWQQFHKILKPGGTLLLTIPHTEHLNSYCIWCPICCEWIIESGHVRSYPPSVVEAEMKVNSFDVIETIKGPNNMYAYKGIKR